MRWHTAAFTAAVATDDVRLIDQCRVMLGLAKAAQLGARLEELIIFPAGLPELLLWKAEGPAHVL